MKTIVLENGSPFGLFNDDYQEKHADNIIAGKKVSEHIFVDAYTDNFINPKWNGEIWIEGATQEEIDAKNLELQKQSINTYKEQWKQDGQAYYDEMQNRIIAMLIGVENAVSIMTEIKQTINPMLEQIQRGNQALAMLDYMDGENNPTIQEVIDLFNEIGQYCITYYQTKYPH